LLNRTVGNGKKKKAPSVEGKRKRFNENRKKLGSHRGSRRGESRKEEEPPRKGSNVKGIRVERHILFPWLRASNLQKVKRKGEVITTARGKAEQRNGEGGGWRRRFPSRRNASNRRLPLGGRPSATREKNYFSKSCLRGPQVTKKRKRRQPQGERRKRK